MKYIVLSIAVLLCVGAGVWLLSQRGDVRTGQTSTVQDIFGYDQGAQVQGTGSEPAGATTTPATSNKKYMNVILHTNKGDITIELLGDDAPKTVENFTKLAKSGFYDGVKFHRIIKGFMIQGGDPLTKDDTQMPRWGTGGPGYTFADEIHDNNRNVAGTISMANAGPNTNGSQFFINVADNTFLDTKHTVFGHVTAGMDVVTAIEHVQTGAGDRPIEPVIITGITLN